MKTYNTDVLVVGSGLAGIRAAIEVKKSGKEVLLVSASPVGRANNSVMAKTIVAFLAPNETGEKFYEDILRVGGNLNDRDKVNLLINNIKEELDFVLDCGVQFGKTINGELNYLTIPGHSEERILRQKDRKGYLFLNPIIKHAQDLGISMMGGVEIVDVLIEESAVYGSVGFNTKGEKMFIKSSAVILATGGMAGIYFNNDNAPSTYGVNYGMALELGLSLRDMEFTQFYPTGLRRNGICRTSFSYENMVAKGTATIRNCNDDDIRKMYNLDDPLSITRDKLSRAIGMEIYKGRGVGEDKKSVLFDLSTLKHREKYEFCIPHFIGPEIEEVLVAPMAHFSMGGVVTEATGKTDIKGLWMAGELVGGLHGANRIAGVAFSECLVSGKLSGREAAEYCSSVKKRNIKLKNDEIIYRSKHYRKHIKEIYIDLKKIMDNYAGVIRSEKGLSKARILVESLKARQASIAESENSAEVLKLGRVLNVALASVISASSRKETRGAHCRIDYSEQSKSYEGSFIIKKDSNNLDITFALNE